jgi:hypothetical protein
MQTKCHSRATHQPPSHNPERRMERRNRRPELGKRREKPGLSRKSDNQEPTLGVHDFLVGINLLCRAIRGRVVDRVYKTYGDKIIVTRVPRFDGYVPTAAQRDRRDKMRAATAYAQSVYADPVAKAVYVAAAKQLGRQPFRLAVSDFLRAHPRVTLSPDIAEATKDQSALRIPAHRPIADSQCASVPRSLVGLAARRNLRSDMLIHCGPVPRAKRARELRPIAACRQRRVPSGSSSGHAKRRTLLLFPPKGRGRVSTSNQPAT